MLAVAVCMVSVGGLGAQNGGGVGGYLVTCVCVCGAEGLSECILFLFIVCAD